MGIFIRKSGGQTKKDAVSQFPSSKNLLLIFTKNPVLGKCKTRLAKDVGDQIALEVYHFLLDHTRKITQDINADKCVCYSIEIEKGDLWDDTLYHKGLQSGEDLGQKMYHAFEEAFLHGYEKVVIIGCDIYEMQKADIEAAFQALESNDYVVGPAKDGGYYLLGMRQLRKDLFQDKNWGTASVLADTLSNLQNEKWVSLRERNDVDTYDDIKEHPDFQPFLKNRKPC